tara:strand:+ start:324 stop:917 length:594 start_codon:yes stop_codon:yes gene_type:complete
MALTTVRSTGISSLPAISAANLTSIPAANITGTLPAISGANLTGVGISMADQWRLTTSFSNDAEPISSNWERVDTAGQGYIGSAMSVDGNGTFTFPSTGIYWVQFTASFNFNGDARFQELYISIAGTKVAQQYSFVTNNGESGANYSNGTTSTTVDVTNTGTQTITFSITGSQSGNNTNGESNKNRTFVTFIRLGDT